MGLNYQKVAARDRATTDNRLEELQDQKPVPYSPQKKRRRWSGERRAIQKWGQDKGSFARKHNLVCSSCGDKSPADWAVAKLGKNNKPYGYCLACYRSWKEKSG